MHRARYREPCSAHADRIASVPGAVDKGMSFVPDVIVGFVLKLSLEVTLGVELGMAVAVLVGVGVTIVVGVVWDM
jgi:hypothetical protein